MSFMDSVIAKVKGAGQVVVLPEGQDPRVINAAATATANDYAKVIVLATPEEVESHKVDGLPVDAGFEIIDWTTSEKGEELAVKLQELRAKKGMTIEDARKAVQNRLYFGALMVKVGMANGLVAGSIASTGDMLRSAFHCIGTAPGIKTASSCMIMDFATPAPNGETSMFFADCAVNIQPDSAGLADIAVATVKTAQSLTDGETKVSFLSFSTKGSAKHDLVDNVSNAKDLAIEKISNLGIENVTVDGELQADASIVPAVGAKKAPDSDVAGQANVLIFPDLQAGNISYKLVERLAGAKAYGPILQGLGGALNDLSRGCSADDIVGVIAITAAQSM